MDEKISRILIVCSGNTARSPVGEYLAKFYAQKYKADLYIESAGEFNAFAYMQPESQAYLSSKNIDHSDFKPQTLSHSLLKKQDLIITMTEHHKENIINDFSNIQEIGNKTFTLKEFNGRKGNIIDPYYTNRATYMKVMKEIDNLIEKMVLKVIDINKTEENK